MWYTADGTNATQHLTLSNSVFDSNYGMQDSPSGDASAVDGGGALYLGGFGGNFLYSVTNTRFVNNTFTSSGFAKTVGGAIYLHNGVLALTGSDLSGNGVNKTGGTGSVSAGAIYVGNDGQYTSSDQAAVLHYNRFAGNTAPDAAIVTAIGTIDAASNWWGCNAGPGTPGCDSVSSGVTTSPFLEFTASANPSTVIGPNGTSALSAGISSDSSGASVDGSNLGGWTSVPVTWSDPTPSPATVQGVTGSAITDFGSNGQASATYDSSTASGPGHVIATLDTSSVTIPLNVEQPADATSTGVSCSPSAVLAFASTTCTATVTDTSASPSTPTGTVRFTAGRSGASFTDAPCTLAGTGMTGVASCAVTLNAGQYATTVNASYVPGTGYTASSGATKVTVKAHVTRTTVSCSSGSCTATVSDASAASHPGLTAITPAGSVSFVSSGSSDSFSGSPCTLSAVSTGVSSCQTGYSLAGAGSRTITATFKPSATPYGGNHVGGSKGATKLNETSAT
jgi:hypothetical protein